MQCPRCQHDNRPQAKFCEECAALLARTCPNCGTQVSPGAKFCSECAHAVTGPVSTQTRYISPETYTPKHLAEKILTSKSALEMEQVRQTIGRAAAGSGQVVALVGEPGVGKSRLVWEVTHSHRTHGWLTVEAGSSSYGKAATFGWNTPASIVWRTFATSRRSRRSFLLGGSNPR
jgi:predicted ATP-dependent serine protease